MMVGFQRARRTAGQAARRGALVFASALATALALASTSRAQEPPGPALAAPPAATELGEGAQGAQPDGAETTVAAAVPDATTQLELMEEARLLFLAGQRAFEAGRYEGALESFRRAYDLTGNGEILYNVAITADRLRRDEEALEAFETYLRESRETPDASMVRGRIRILREQIARRQLEAPAPAPAPAPDPETPRDDRDGGSVLSSWWLWAIVGAAVVGGIVATVALTASDADPTPGDEGVVLFTLRAP